MHNENAQLRQRVQELEREVTTLRSERPTESEAAQSPQKFVRRRSEKTIWGLPLWEISSGRDAQGARGHARAIFAVGDIADGVVAVGGVARGVFCLGGVAIGAVCLGGVAISLLAAMGGVAIGGLAYGGAAVGGVAVGGASVGIYAKGDAATGVHAMDRKEKDPEAVRFFEKWTRWQ